MVWQVFMLNDDYVASWECEDFSLVANPTTVKIAMIKAFINDYSNIQTY